MLDKQIENVIKSFVNFLLEYQRFRNMSDLKNKKINNIHEILTSMTDKHGRICRYVKHQERNDPKSDWPDGLSSAFTGYLVYTILLMEYYNINIQNGMKQELEESIKQHGL